MSKKQDAYYFENFIACTDLACQAAHLLLKAIEDFDPAALPERLEEIHRTEHAADMKKHELLNTLAKAFITPLEREDIMLLSQNIDEVTDKLEDVLVETHLRQFFVYNKYMQFSLKNQYNSIIFQKYKPPKEHSLRGL